MPQLAAARRGGWLPADSIAHRLQAELARLGFSHGAASAVAGAAVDQEQLLKRLADPVRQRTSVGIVLTVPGAFWTPRVSVYPDNKRDAVERPLPISSVDLTYPPLAAPTSDGAAPYLTLGIDTQEQLGASLVKSESHLLAQNSLVDELRSEGILRPITLIAIEARLRDGSARSFLASADGSSRIASAHRILGITADQVVFGYVPDDRFFGRFVDGASVGNSDRGRVLTAPADLVVGIETDYPTTDATARAVRTLVGLMHVQPPTGWTPGSQLDAQGDEVLGDLEAAGIIGRTERDYMSGRITFAAAVRANLPSNGDERAALIVSTFRDNQGLVRDAIRRISHAARVGNARLANVATELAGRSFRGDRDHATLELMSRSRVGLQLAYRMKEIWTTPWEPTLRTPEELHVAALAELDAGSFGPARAELGVKGAFELARYRVLTQYSLRKGVAVSNLASPSAILRALTSSGEGLGVLRQALIDGRSKALGISIPSSPSEAAGAMSADWLRNNFDPSATPPDLPDLGPIPERLYDDQRDHIRALILALESSFDSLSNIENEAGQKLVDVVGWPAEDARHLAQVLFMLRDAHAYASRKSIGESATFEAQPEGSDDEDWR
jgi:hypothetical protein